MVIPVAGRIIVIFRLGRASKRRLYVISCQPPVLDPTRLSRLPHTGFIDQVLLTFGHQGAVIRKELLQVRMMPVERAKVGDNEVLWGEAKIIQAFRYALPMRYP
jgi:hypothetical protein